MLRAAIAVAMLGMAAVRAPAQDAAAKPSPDAPTGEVRLRWDDRLPSTTGPLAEANALVPGIAAAIPSAAVAQAWARGTLRRGKVALTAEALAWQQHTEHGDASGAGRVDELFAAADRGAWQFSAGKQVVSWDVGYGFRPNDVVQQERRRTLLPERLEGRAVIDAEHFSADRALTLVAVQPQRWNDGADATRGADEAAVAGRGYWRAGTADAYAFGRWGRHTGWSLGAAGAWVASDSVELHASARWLNAHDGWQIAGNAGIAPQPANPWSLQTLPGGNQALVGASWTGQAQQSVLVEAWHDGTALADSQWNDWLARNRALAASPAPTIARAANLAWQATPFDSVGLRRDNLYLRLAWHPAPWLVSLDALVTPADHGRIVTASLQWQGDRWRFDAALRWYGGPADAVIAQLPIRRTGLLALTWAW